MMYAGSVGSGLVDVCGVACVANDHTFVGMWRSLFGIHRVRGASLI